MTIRDDVGLLRRFARNTNDAHACTARAVLDAVIRLYGADHGSPHGALAKLDVAELRAQLNAVPMTVEQREAVAFRIGRLEEAAAHEAPPPLVEYTTCTKCGQTFTGDCCLPCDRARERHAEMAIECITNAIGIHNYQEAAQAVLATWRAAVQMRKDRGLMVADSAAGASAVAASAVNIAVAAAKDHDAIKTLHAIFHTTTIERLVAVAQGAHHEAAEAGYFLGVLKRWRNDRCPNRKDRIRFLCILRTLQPDLAPELRNVARDVIDLVDYLLNEIPF